MSLVSDAKSVLHSVIFFIRQGHCLAQLELEPRLLMHMTDPQWQDLREYCKQTLSQY